MADLDAFPLSLGVAVEFGGAEVPGPVGGPINSGTERAANDQPLPLTAGVHECDAGPWKVRSTVTVRPDHPRLELRIAARHRGDGELLLRDLVVTFTPDGTTGWIVEAPGNMIRPGVELSTLLDDVVVLGPGHELGSPGLTALHRDDGPTVVVWPFSRADSASTVVRRDGGAIEIDTGLAGAVTPDAWIEHGPIYLDVVPRPWDDVIAEVAGWYASIGLSTPPDRPAWTESVSIFEVMVGAAPFHGGISYAPYPEIADLVADLDRIAALGFDCLQLMPRHPYPSYNIHRPGDVATTYGDPDEIRWLVAECHRRDLRIIFDVLIHGVVDKDVIRRTLAHVDHGPYADRLGEPCDDLYDPDSEIVSWSRHIVEFAPAWIAGSPTRHPLLDEHPEWFMRNSAGAVVGKYTHALDIANREWQDHFIDSCVAVVRDYGIDGFRFDAPLYNRFANWSPATRHHASHSSLAAFDLLHRMRSRLHTVRDDLLLHSEPGGALARESLDLCYSYEERWLPGALFDHRQQPRYDWRRVRNGAELARWFRDYDAALPPGSVSAHYLDVHDTMWWLLPGDWWRRDQIGLAATKAALVIHALRGGAYMTFVGGEIGIEDELRRVHTLRREVAALGHGIADYDAVRCDHPEIYCVIRRDGDEAVIVAVNTSDAAVTCTLHLDDRGVSFGDGPLWDLWSGEQLAAASTPRSAGGPHTLTLTFADLQPRVIATGPRADEASRRSR